MAATPLNGHWGMSKQWLPHLSLTRTKDNPILFISQWRLMHVHSMAEGNADAPSLHWKMKRSEAWFPTARHVLLIAQDSLYQGSSTLISDITDQYRLPSMERDLLECNSSQFTGVSNDRGISQTGACCTLKTQPISSNITPPPLPPEISSEHKIPLIAFKIHEV